MLNWYIEILPWAPKSFNNDKKIKNNINCIITHIMNIFHEKLFELEEVNLKNAGKVLIDIIDEMPIMKADMQNGELIIRYNRFVNVKLKDPLKSIYRDIKLNKLLNK